MVVSINVTIPAHLPNTKLNESHLPNVMLLILVAFTQVGSAKTNESRQTNMFQLTPSSYPIWTAGVQTDTSPTSQQQVDIDGPLCTLNA
jgi:hypothetical protein